MSPSTIGNATSISLTDTFGELTEEFPKVILGVELREA